MVYNFENDRIDIGADDISYNSSFKGDNLDDDDDNDNNNSEEIVSNSDNDNG